MSRCDWKENLDRLAVPLANSALEGRNTFLSCSGRNRQEYLRELFTEPETVDSVFPDLVANDAFRGVENLCGLHSIAACGLEGILNEISLIRADGFGEGDLA